MPCPGCWMPDTGSEGPEVSEIWFSIEKESFPLRFPEGPRREGF